MNAAWLQNSSKIQYLGDGVGWGVSYVGTFQNKRQTVHLSYCLFGTLYTSDAMLRGGNANSLFNVQQQRVELNFCVPQRGPLNKSRPEKALDSFQSDY